MRPGHRYCIAFALAAVVFLATVGMVFRLARPVATPRPKMEAPAPIPPEVIPQPATVLIEEVLAEERSESPEAIYFTNRIRETVRGNNPTFGRELLRQFKEQHPDSILIYEAEKLLETTRQSHE